MPSLSPRETFDRHIGRLLDEVLVLGSMVEQAILDSVDALRRRDVTASRRIRQGDQRINEKRYAIEMECLTLIATQQPMARDLRMLAAILEIITELERMGDYAKGISKINIILGDTPVDRPVADLQQMTDIGLGMLRKALDAFIRQDADLARVIPADDDTVDALYLKIYREVVQEIINNPSQADQMNTMMWAAHNIERMADRVINICERIIFVSTGEMKELDVSDEQIENTY